MSPLTKTDITTTIVIVIVLSVCVWLSRNEGLPLQDLLSLSAWRMGHRMLWEHSSAAAAVVVLA